MTHNNMDQPDTKTWTAEEEHRLADWLTTQRILHDCGALSAGKAAILTSTLGGWFRPPTDRELGRALNSDNPELNEALVTWFNRNELYPQPLTLTEIRVYAEIEAAI